MKTILSAIAAALLLPGALLGQTMNIHTSGGTTPFNLSDIDSITFTADTSSSGIWTTRAPMPTARMGMGCGVVNGKIYVIGGFNGSKIVGLSTVEMYDPAANTWTTKAPMPTPRLDPSVATVNGKIYVIGGKSTYFLSTVEVYNPDSNVWHSCTSMPTARQYAACSVISGKIYVIGGFTDPSSPLATVEIYDPEFDGWSTRASMPLGVCQMPAASIGDTMYTMGGMTAGYATTDTVLRYTPNAWATGVALPAPNKYAAAAAYNGGIYCIGGAASNACNPGLTTVRYFAPGQAGWAAKTSMTYGRCGLVAAVAGGKIYAIGGGRLNGSWEYYQYVEAYDPSLDVK